MILAGRLARFRLSAEGVVALKELFEKPTFSAFVVSVDELGAWIDIGSKSGGESGESRVLVLLKWDYFVTAVLDYKPAEPVEKEPVGFVTGRRS